MADTIEMTPPDPSDDPFDAIVDAPFDSALEERYLVYALSTITARSLPDLRDGLKPVHRRLLWAMRQLKLDPSSAFKKSARVVGDVIGKYHPHGDARSEEHTSELQSLMRISYAGFCLTKKNKIHETST